MKNKNTILIVVIAVVMVAVGINTYLSNHSSSEQTNTPITSSYNPQTQGKVVFGITDNTENMANVSSVLITVNKVEMHSADTGWFTVSNEVKDYDLLVLKKYGVVSLLATANINVGTYDQVRLNVSKVVVTRNGVAEVAKLPSGELKIVGAVVVNADKTSSAVFDFQADKSMHITGNGKFIFAPVIKFKRRHDAKVELKSNNEVDIKDGKEDNDEDFGMDSKGEFRNNFELKGKLEIDEHDEIKGEDNNNEGDNEGKVETNDDLKFNFSAQNNSGLSGTATIGEEDGKVKVNLKLASNILGLLSTAEPAHIHTGSCANIGAVKYPLNSVVNGKSETKLNVSLADLKVGLPLAINVHKSVAEINIYTACTNINF